MLPTQQIVLGPWSLAVWHYNMENDFTHQYLMEELTIGSMIKNISLLCFCWGPPVLDIDNTTQIYLWSININLAETRFV